jgi:hypothetical protein
MQTATGKFYPKLVLEKINQVIVKCFLWILKTIQLSMKLTQNCKSSLSSFGTWKTKKEIQ